MCEWKLQNGHYGRKHHRKMMETFWHNYLKSLEQVGNKTGNLLEIPLVFGEVSSTPPLGGGNWKLGKNGAKGEMIVAAWANGEVGWCWRQGHYEDFGISGTELWRRRELTLMD